MYSNEQRFLIVIDTSISMNVRIVCKTWRAFVTFGSASYVLSKNLQCMHIQNGKKKHFSTKSKMLYNSKPLCRKLSTKQRHQAARVMPVQ